jgi:hypothetical protein
MSASPRHPLALTLLGPLLLLACSDEAATGGGTDVGPDALADSSGDGDAPAPDGEDDVVTVGEVGTPDLGEGCDPRLLAEAWRWNDAVTTRSVAVSEQGGVFTATLDASAGGYDHARFEPFVYLDLEAAARVDLTDLEALADTTWDLAFKRTLIRTNSADSGPGQIALARVSGLPFEDVSTAPSSHSAWATDESLDEDCELLTDPIGNPMTAINWINGDNASGSSSWYNYDGGVSPNPGDVYLVRNGAEGTTYKLEIVSWSSGLITLRWAEL